MLATSIKRGLTGWAADRINEEGHTTGVVRDRLLLHAGKDPAQARGRGEFR
jgi:hypothetical protein